MKLKLNNLFHLAFIAILVKVLVAGFSTPAIAALGIVVALIGLQDYLEVIKIKEEILPLSKKIETLQKELDKTKDDSRQLINDAVIEMNVRMTKVENASKMVAFQAKK